MGILDFSNTNTYGSYIYIMDFFISESSFLVLENFSISTLRYVNSKIEHGLDRILLKGSDGILYKTRVSRDWSGYYKLDFGERFTPPIPEPATYGAAFGVVGLGFGFFRRRRRAASALAELAVGGERN